MLLQDMEEQGLLKPPKWLSSNTHCLMYMGSRAYGVADNDSDFDVYGWVIPPKEIVFPHLAGEIQGFGRQKKRFEHFVEHHVADKTGGDWDFSIFNVVKYFSLCMECNPNMLDSLFVPQNCLIHSTRISQMVRESRRLFLSKVAWHRFKGYAYSQLHKMQSKNPIGKRKQIRDEFGYDVKFAYHVVRLLSEVEQILAEGDLDLQEKGRREHMKAVRRGEVSEDDIRRWASDKERQLESLYHTSTLPYSPDEAQIKGLLLHVLEEHYGTLDKCVVKPEKALQALRSIHEILERNGDLL